MRWKWTLGIVAAVLVAIFIAVFMIISSYDYNKLKPIISKSVNDITGRELNINGEIKLKIGFSPSLMVQNVDFQNASWGSRPHMAKIKRFELDLSLIPLIWGHVNVKRLNLIAPDILIEINKSGVSNLAFKTRQTPPEESAQKPTQQLEIALKKMEIHNARLAFKDQQSDRVHTLNIHRLNMKAPALEAFSDFVLEGTYDRISYRVEGKLGPFAELLDPAKSWPVELKTRAMGINVSLKGTIRDVMNLAGVDIALNIDGEDFAGFEQITGSPLPLKGSFAVSGHVNAPSMEKVSLSDFSATFSQNQITGVIALDISAKKPRIEATLSSKALDMRSMMADARASLKTEVQPAETTDKSKKVFSNTPLNLEVLNKFDALIRLRIAHLLLPNVALKDLDTGLKLENGHLIVQPLSALIGAGHLAGHLDLNAQPEVPALTAKLEVEEFDLGNMLNDLSIADAADGKISIDVKAKSRGHSVAALMGSLNGHVQLAMSEGRIQMDYLNLIGADMRASLGRLFNPLEEKQQYAQMNCFVCRFNIQDGLADSDIFLVDTNRVTVAGKGSVDLKTERLDFKVQPEPKEGLGIQQTGKISISLSEFAQPLRLGGTLATPKLAIDAKGTALTLSKSIGGMALLGPAGIFSALISKGSGDKHPCLTAIENLKATESVAKGNGNPEEKKASEKKSNGIGGIIKGIFSKPKN
jgi:hypothetical protein